MILGFHSIFGTYGFWLPKRPAGIMVRFRGGYRVLACAILPEHVHLVIGWTPRDIRRIVGHFKGRGAHFLDRGRLWPESQRPVWGENGWNVFIDNLEHLQAAVKYVEDNPLKEGKKRQHWPFVTPITDYLSLI